MKIDKKIVSGSVVETPTSQTVQHLHESLARPEMLLGSTYKIKPPLSDHALYITINDIVLNQGTEHEARHPFEIFINSKAMDHFQWIVAMTRIISAVFRKGGECAFLAEEMRSVFDPKGGYFKKGGRYMPSLVAEIGEVIEDHMRSIGLLNEEGLDGHQEKLIAEARAKHDKASNSEDSGFPSDASLCGKCFMKSIVVLDGCATCLNCGDSKCG